MFSFSKRNNKQKGQKMRWRCKGRVSGSGSFFPTNHHYLPKESSYILVAFHGLVYLARLSLFHHASRKLLYLRLQLQAAGWDFGNLPSATAVKGDFSLQQDSFTPSLRPDIRWLNQMLGWFLVQLKWSAPMRSPLEMSPPKPEWHWQTKAPANYLQQWLHHI